MLSFVLGIFKVRYAGLLFGISSEKNFRLSAWLECDKKIPKKYFKAIPRSNMMPAIPDNIPWLVLVLQRVFSSSAPWLAGFSFFFLIIISKSVYCTTARQIKTCRKIAAYHYARFPFSSSPYFSNFIYYASIITS